MTVILPQLWVFMHEYTFVVRALCDHALQLDELYDWSFPLVRRPITGSSAAEVALHCYNPVSGGQPKQSVAQNTIIMPFSSNAGYTEEVYRMQPNVKT